MGGIILKWHKACDTKMGRQGHVGQQTKHALYEVTWYAFSSLQTVV